MKCRTVVSCHPWYFIVIHTCTYDETEPTAVDDVLEVVPVDNLQQWDAAVLLVLEGHDQQQLVMLLLLGCCCW